MQLGKVTRISLHNFQISVFNLEDKVISSRGRQCYELINYELDDCINHKWLKELNSFITFILSD